MGCSPCYRKCRRVRGRPKRQRWQDLPLTPHRCAKSPSRIVIRKHNMFRQSSGIVHDHHFNPRSAQNAPGRRSAPSTPTCGFKMDIRQDSETSAAECSVFECPAFKISASILLAKEQLCSILRLPACLHILLQQHSYTTNTKIQVNSQTATGSSSAESA